MDTITQAVLGGAIGEAGFRHRLGGRAVVFGAACGLLPDLDVLTRVAGEWESLVHHRGVTHSLVVLPFLAPLVGALGARIFGGRADFKAWTHLAFWGLVTHPLLDVFTTYGTQLLAPVSRARFALDGVAIIDPIYTLPLIVAVVLAARRGTDRTLSRRFAQVALAFGAAYLLAGAAVSGLARQDARAALASRGVDVEAVRTPTPIGFFVLRRVVARSADGTFYVAVWSLFARDALNPVALRSDDDPRIARTLDTEAGRIMLWFSDGFLRARVDGAEVRLEDLRYGLYRDLAWTPFAAVATFDAAGAATSVRRAGRGRRPDVGAELSAGWDYVWGRSADHRR